MELKNILERYLFGWYLEFVSFLLNTSNLTMPYKLSRSTFLFRTTALGMMFTSSLAMAAAQEYDIDTIKKQQHQNKASEPSMENIVVTGTKRNTNLLKTDVSVTLIDSTIIDEARVRDFTRIDDLVPNVQFSESGQTGSVYITIRGVESNPFIVNRAAVYIDGIPFRELSNSVLSQVNSIEVLRGPQGTLYGANSESGLIIVNTKTPSEVVEQNYRVSMLDYSSGQGYKGTGFIGGPLVQGELNGSLSFSTSSEDAYIKNIATSTGESGSIREDFVQGRINWTPSDTLTVNATTYLLEEDAPGLFVQQYVPLNISLYNKLYADSMNGGRRLDEWTTFEDSPKYTSSDEFVVGVSVTNNTDIGAIDLAASYRSRKEDSKGLDFDFTAAPYVSGREEKNEDYNNIELRFTSLENGTFDYIVGISYYEESVENTKSTFMGSGDLNSYLAAPMQYKEGKDKSIFGSVNWYVTDKLKFGAGIRYDNAQRSAVQTAGYLDLGLGTITHYQDADLTKSFNNWLPRLSALYQLNPHLSFHASVSKGYIPGGFNLTAIQDDIVDDSVLSYESETLTSHELGYKWLSGDRNWRSSGAVFYISSDNWQELQVATDANGRPVSSDYIGSEASITSKGVEFEVSWHPSEAFSLNSHLGYVDAEYDDLQTSETFNAAGLAVQFVPQYDAGLAARYSWENDFYIRAEANFTGKTSLRAKGDIIQGAVTTLGFQLGYDNGKMALRVFGENLTGERRASGLAVENMAFGTDGLFYSPLDKPRIIGLEAEIWF
ncbi:TonB-dependent receptor [Pseudoalteromonas sp. KG3]|uniref:TonB-dependent receptor n=1 Tax=Pseudoalteromonas sp. KG3 TaxID=2951137 RepID=UPI0026580BDA|nr:TonB-dependent receptor [Pseudoalteromonas sp. KG3]WKD25484.1 TonB-dependent receptor [Pseudoalteromonas sp. KG3]